MDSKLDNISYEFPIITGDSYPDSSFGSSRNAPIALSPVEIAAAWQNAPNLDDPASRLITKAEGLALFERITKLTKGDGITQVTIRSSSVGNLRWARNRPTTSGITMTRLLRISRSIEGHWSSAVTTSLDDESLSKVISAIEGRLQPMQQEHYPAQTYVSPKLWYDSTLNVTANDRSNAARKSVEIIAAQKFLAAGYVETDVETWGVYNTLGLAAYAAVNSGRFQISVRDPKGNGAGWRGVSDNDWGKLNTDDLSRHTLEMCIASAHPRAIEPGRYTTIIHQDVVAAMMMHVSEIMDRYRAEREPNSVFGLELGKSRIGTKVIDERLSLISDPMDPVTPFIPFDDDGYPMKRTVWIENGILKELKYPSWYAQKYLETKEPLPYPYSCRLVNNGPVTSVEDMIASTKRGIYLEQTGMSRTVHPNSLQIRTITKDGIWWIENGKRKFPIKNMYILESPVAVLNRVVQIGEPARAWGRRFMNSMDNSPWTVLHNGAVPMTVPPMKVEDFNFVMLADAV